MKIEFKIEGKLVVIEAEGAVSVQIREISEEVVPVQLVSEPEPCDLFQKLVEVRKELSAEQNVPPYVIFHDKTLNEMVEKLPSDLSEFGKIGGVGQAKLEKYGARFLSVIQGVVA